MPTLGGSLVFDHPVSSSPKFIGVTMGVVAAQEIECGPCDSAVGCRGKFQGMETCTYLEGL